MSPNKHKCELEQPEPDTETGVAKKRGWKKWLSLGGLTAIGTIFLAIPVMESCGSRVHAIYNVPEEIAAQGMINSNLQGAIDTLQLHGYDDREWRAKTDTRLDDIEKMLNRILDNQEQRPVQAAPTPDRNLPPHDKGQQQQPTYAQP